GRISKAVVLEIKLEAVSRPDVLFFDRNATKSGAKQSVNPDIIRFDIVKAPSHFDVAERLRQFYQAEVLVPSPIPPELISFPAKTVAYVSKAARAPKKRPPQTKVRTVYLPRPPPLYLPLM